MADTPTLLPRLEPYTSAPDLHYPVLVPNLRGLQNLLSLRKQTSQPLTNEIAIFIAASDSFSKANTHAPTSKIVAGLPPIFQLAAEQDPPLRVRAYISTVISCPFEGRVEPERVADLAEQMIALGAYEISLGDTTGEGGVDEWKAVWKAVTSRIGTERVAAHVSLSSLTLSHRLTHTDSRHVLTRTPFTPLPPSLGSPNDRQQSSRSRWLPLLTRCNRKRTDRRRSLCPSQIGVQDRCRFGKVGNGWRVVGTGCGSEE